MFVTGDAARYVLVPDGDPDGARASQALSRVAEDLPEPGAPSSGSHPVAIIVPLLLPRVLLRSWKAPLYLVGVSVLVVAGAPGITVYVLKDLLGYGEPAFIVPAAGPILLLALGPTTTSS